MEKFRVRPEYQSKDLLAEFWGDHRGDNFPDIQGVLAKGPDRGINMEELVGGRKGRIFKSEGTVARPLNPWSPTIHRLLTHLHQKGVEGCPEYVGVEADKEILSFVEGDT